jgi:Core-2/I-Branching enzyme
MVDAEKRLLANALEDPDNQFFVLLSDRFYYNPKNAFFCSFPTSF